ncbi:DUF7697 family protein [Aestuariivita sp.]|uniref:DUF7697 family protein n=1 Tax=Aestuariivita sp. TaxID=1872407 RepID=UPI003BB02D55
MGAVFDFLTDEDRVLEPGDAAPLPQDLVPVLEDTPCPVVPGRCDAVGSQELAPGGGGRLPACQPLTSAHVRLGLSPLIIAELLPPIEAVMVRKTNEEIEHRHG